METQNVYIKKGRRYVPYGVTYDRRAISDGLYYVSHHGDTTTSIPYMAGMFRVGDAQPIDVPKLCGMEDMCNKILDSKEWGEMIRGNFSLNDLVHLCVKKMYEQE